MVTELIMPEMGEGVIEGTVVSWLKQEGDVVNEDEPVVEVETDKVTVEINAEVDGTLLKVHVPEGTLVSVGTVLATIGQEGESLDAPAESVQEPVAVSVPRQEEYAAEDDHQYSRQANGKRMSPVVARMVQEHDLDIMQINGTGRDGRVTKRDVLAFMEETTPGRPVEQPRPRVTEAAPEPSNDADLVPLTGMRRSIAEHMVLSKRTSPHVTTVFEFDFSAVAAHRKANKEAFAKDGIKLTYMPYLALATIGALKAHPMANASWTDDGILLKRDIHLGIAVAVSTGLLVPVIKHAEDKNLRGLAREINDLADRARRNKLKPDEVRGGTFSITNHGASGSLIGTPIINQPQVGILGVGMIEKRVKVINDMIAVRPCAYISFSFDHRILDGASADAFVMDVKRYIESYL